MSVNDERLARLEAANTRTNYLLIALVALLAVLLLRSPEPAVQFLPQATAGGAAEFGPSTEKAPKHVFTSSADGSRLFVWRVGEEGWAVGRGYNSAKEGE